jgi:hypothetical protein
MDTMSLGKDLYDETPPVQHNIHREGRTMNVTMQIQNKKTFVVGLMAMLVSCFGLVLLYPFDMITFILLMFFGIVAIGFSFIPKGWEGE